MRYFLYTYAYPENYEISREHRVFGTPKNSGDHLATKVQRLRRGDIVLIRDGFRNDLRFFPYCVVTGPLFDQETDTDSSWPKFLWHDEKLKQRVIYHLRCEVDFQNVPQLSRSRLTWDSLDSLRFINERGRPILGQQAWGKKLSGNFIEDEKELAKFNDLVMFDPLEEATPSPTFERE